MGRIYAALQRARTEATEPEFRDPEPFVPAEVPDSGPSVKIDLAHTRTFSLNSDPEQRLVALSRQRTSGSEKIQILTSRLRRIQDERKIKKLLITSPLKQEGKTVLAANVAISFARSGQRVLLIDGDCHEAAANRLLGANHPAGLTDWWCSGGTGSIQDYLSGVNELPLWFLPAGNRAEQPLEMLQSEHLSKMIAELSSLFDWLVIDSPPLAPVADAAVWAKVADGILFVVRDGKTPKRLLRKLVESLDSDKLLGMILNDCSDPDQQYYSSYYNFPESSTRPPA